MNEVCKVSFIKIISHQNNAMCLISSFMEKPDIGFALAKCMMKHLWKNDVLSNVYLIFLHIYLKFQSFVDGFCRCKAIICFLLICDTSLIGVGMGATL